jgi:hypothetical protein
MLCSTCNTTLNCISGPTGTFIDLPWMHSPVARPDQHGTDQSKTKKRHFPGFIARNRRAAFETKLYRKMPKTWCKIDSHILHKTSYNFPRNLSNLANDPSLNAERIGLCDYVTLDTRTCNLKNLLNCLCCSLAVKCAHFLIAIPSQEFCE